LKKKKLTTFLRRFGVAFILCIVLWYFIEIPLLEHLPNLMYDIFGRSPYGVQKIDKQGIPYMVYPKLGMERNPLMVAHQAITYYSYLSNEQNLKGFCNCTNWLAHNLTIQDNKAYAYNTFPLPAYGLNPPWASALTQSTVLVALQLRYGYEQNNYWLDLGEKVLNTFQSGENSFTVTLSDSSYWYEEYPSDPHSFVLNGMLSTLLNLHTYYTATSDTIALKLFDKGYQAVLQKLPEYDATFISLYDLQGRIASMGYHCMHIDLLKELDAVRPDPLPEAYIHKWSIYRYIPAPLQLIFNFKPMRCAAFCLCWLGLTALLYFLAFLYDNYKKKRRTG